MDDRPPVVENYGVVNNGYDNNNQQVVVENQKLDRCRWACCRCPNGLWAGIFVNVFLWTAVVFSGGALVDCHLVEADIGSNLTTWPPLPPNLVGLTDGLSTDRRGFGFFIHEQDDGNCQWAYWGEIYDSEDFEDSEDRDAAEDDIEDYIRDYFDWMGFDWRRKARLASSACLLAFLGACSVGMYACLSHVWILRYGTGVLAMALVAPLQLVVLGIPNSDFCQDRDCEYGRSSMFCLIAGILFFLAGIPFFFMKAYPGTSTAETMDYQQQPPPPVVPAAPAVVEEPATTVGGGGDGIEEGREIKAEVY